MAKMRIAPQDRPKVRLQILRLLAQLRLDHRKMDLIAQFVSTYLALTTKEYLAFNHELDKIENRQERAKVMQVIDEFQRKARREGREEGRQEGKRAVVEELLAVRFGELSNQLEQQIKKLSLRQIEELAKSLFTFSSIADLKRWLEQHR
jgi:predicted transposase YdaD